MHAANGALRLIALRERDLGVLASLPTVATATPVAPAMADGGEDALGVLLALLREDMEACNRSIVARMTSPVGVPLEIHSKPMARKAVTPARMCSPMLRRNRMLCWALCMSVMLMKCGRITSIVPSTWPRVWSR